MNTSAAFRGLWTVHRQDRASGEWLEPLVGENTILTAGKQIFLDLMFDIGTPAATEQFTNARAQVKIYNASDGLEQTLGAKSGYPSHGSEDSGTVEYWFEDISTDVYVADRIDFLNSTSGKVFSKKDPTSFGTKPDSQNWTYKYTLSITQNSDTDLSMDGLDHALRLLTGNRVITDEVQWKDGDVKLHIENNGDSVSSDLAEDATYPSRSAETVTIVFTASTSQNNQEWYNLAVRGNFTTVGQTELSRTQENLGTKDSTIQREYTFTFSL
jgi:hypothetical protein